jgi:hypothetical protein
MNKYQDYRHIWLYAKGHYEYSDIVLEDLQKIISERNMIEPEYVQYEYILKILLDIIMEHSSHHLVTGYVLEAFGVVRLFKNKEWTKQDTLISLLGKISILPLTKKDGSRVELGKADKDIIPLNKKSIYNQ